MIIDCPLQARGPPAGGPDAVAEAAGCAARTEGSSGWVSTTRPRRMDEVAEAFPGARAGDRGRAVEAPAGEDRGLREPLLRRPADRPLRRRNASEVDSARSTSSPGPATRSLFATARRASSHRLARGWRPGPSCSRRGRCRWSGRFSTQVVDDYEPVVDGLTRGHRGRRGAGVRGRGRPDRAHLLPEARGDRVLPGGPPAAGASGGDRARRRPAGLGAMQNYFRDVNDHVKLVHDEISSQRELLTSILEANLAVLGARQNRSACSRTRPASSSRSSRRSSCRSASSPASSA